MARALRMRTRTSLTRAMKQRLAQFERREGERCGWCGGYNCVAHLDLDDLYRQLYL